MPVLDLPVEARKAIVIVENGVLSVSVVPCNSILYMFSLFLHLCGDVIMYSGFV